jgi:hypothetical protein
MTVTIGAGSAKTVLDVGKTENGDSYARMRRGRWCSRSTHAARDLEQELRRLPQEGAVRVPAVLSRKMRAVLDTPGGAKTFEFEKQKPAKPADPETWKVTRVGGSSHTADQTSMDDLLNKLVAIKAETFVDGENEDGHRQARSRRQRQLRRRQVRARPLWPRWRDGLRIARR